MGLPSTLLPVCNPLLSELIFPFGTRPKADACPRPRNDRSADAFPDKPAHLLHSVRRHIGRWTSDALNVWKAAAIDQSGQWADRLAACERAVSERKVQKWHYPSSSADAVGAKLLPVRP